MNFFFYECFYDQTIFFLCTYFLILCYTDCIFHTFYFRFYFVKIMLDTWNLQNYTKVKFVCYIPLRRNFVTLSKKQNK